MVWVTLLLDLRVGRSSLRLHRLGRGGESQAAEMMGSLLQSVLHERLSHVGLGEREVSCVWFHYDDDDNRIHEVFEIKSPITLQAKCAQRTKPEISSVPKHPLVLPHPVEK